MRQDTLDEAKRAVSKAIKATVKPLVEVRLVAGDLTALTLKLVRQYCEDELGRRMRGQLQRGWLAAITGAKDAVKEVVDRQLTRMSRRDQARARQAARQLFDDE